MRYMLRLAHILRASQAWAILPTANLPGSLEPRVLGFSRDPAVNLAVPYGGT